MYVCAGWLRALALLALLAALPILASHADHSELSVDASSPEAQRRLQQQQQAHEPAVETVHKAVNGSGYYCRGCAVMVEAVHQHILSTVERWGEPGFTIEVRDFLDDHCAGSARRGEEQQIQHACNDLKSYGGVIGTRHFGASLPSDSALYLRTLQICTDELGVCYAAPIAPPSLTKKKGRRAKRWCTACATIATDLHDVLTRRDRADSSFLSNDHVRAAITTQCAHLPRRFLGGRALSKLEEVCEELEDTGALRQLQLKLVSTAAKEFTLDFVLNSLCGVDNDSVADNVDCGSDEVLAQLAWRSPFATTEMSKAAVQACERSAEDEDSHECKTSEFVDALLAGKFPDLASARADDLELNRRDKHVGKHRQREVTAKDKDKPTGAEEAHTQESVAQKRTGDGGTEGYITKPATVGEAGAADERDEEVSLAAEVAWVAAVAERATTLLTAGDASTCVAGAAKAALLAAMDEVDDHQVAATDSKNHQGNG